MHPEHAEAGVERYDGMTVYRHKEPLREYYAEREFGIEHPNRRDRLLGKPRYFDEAELWPKENRGRPDFNWYRR